MEELKTSRAERRGKVKRVWDSITESFIFYKLSKRGFWIMPNNMSAKQISKRQMNKLIN
jgi:hypothetical protein